MRGNELAAAYAAEAVGPLLNREAPGVPVALARLGSGSDVLGLDDATSRDHDWGARLTVLVPEPEVARVADVLERMLPADFRGHPVRFPVSWDRTDHQRAEVVAPLAFARDRTGLDLSHEPTTLEWLSLTGQAALEVVGGPVFRDDDGVLTGIRVRLAHYPDDVRLFALASGWRRIGQELPFLGRTAQRGDEAGARILAGRMVRTAMQIGFLLERRWSPYSKWLGTAFAALPHVGALVEPARHALTAGDAAERERALATLFDGLAGVQGETGLPTVLPSTAPFRDRPVAGLRVLSREDAGEGSDGLGLPEVTRDAIGDPGIRSLPLAGTPEQWSDSVDVLMPHATRIAMTRALYPGLG